MPELIMNLEALAHNAMATANLAACWRLNILPVMKGADGHPAAALTLIGNGFRRLAYADLDEAGRFGGPAGDRAGRVLIGLTPPARAAEVVATFGRSFQSRPETVLALDRAAHALGLDHEILLLVDLGGHREGLTDPLEINEILDLVAGCGRLKLLGLATTIGCLDGREPGPWFLPGLAAVRALFRGRGCLDPLVSVGGSVLLSWLTPERLGPITELRVGDPFFLGRDTWRDRPLPGGPFREDVFTLAATVVEVRGARALVDAGRFHIGEERPVSLWPGVAVRGRSAGYLVLETAPDAPPPEVGERVLFRPGYWNVAAACRNPAVRLVIRPETPIRR